MATITLAPAIARWLTATPGADAAPVQFQTTAVTLKDALTELFRVYPQLRGYVLDERGVIRHHVVAFVDNVVCTDKSNQSELLRPESEVYLFQALSGG